MRLIDLTSERFGSLIVLGRGEQRAYGRRVTWICKCDCGEFSTVVGEALRTGATRSCGCLARRGRKQITYVSAHRRIYRSRGPASNHRCVDCGENAQQWSYDGTDEREIFCDVRKMKFSLDENHYAPRCAPCHKRHDNQTRRASTAQKHDAPTK